MRSPLSFVAGILGILFASSLGISTIGCSDEESTPNGGSPKDDIGPSVDNCLDNPGSPCSQNGGTMCNGSGECIYPTAIAAGRMHTCALTPSGGAKCRGGNQAGYLGDGTWTARPVPTQVVGFDAGLVEIVAGGEQSCAITSTGSAHCWGSNACKSLGIEAGNSSNVPMQVVGLESGTVGISANLLRCDAIFDGSHTCAVTGNGGVMCWGRNNWGQLGSNPNAYVSVPEVVPGLERDMVAVSVGDGHTCALTSQGGVRCLGYNAYGALGNGTHENSNSPTQVVGLESGVVAISAGGNVTCAITEAGGVQCWGYNQHGELGNGTSYETDPTDDLNGFRSLVPTQVVGLTSGVMALSTGMNPTCVVTTKGAVKCWGRNIGNVSTQVSGLESDMIAVSTGAEHTCALSSNGTAECWGKNEHGQLGDGSTTDRPFPVIVTNFP